MLADLLAWAGMATRWLHVIAGTHHLHMEDPATVAALVSAFLMA